eukprot:TRINITY_DN31040_c0_g1_i1.p1 TRINITY_DN31040_c0_g1~~TRINITY_DN31040_c0_g1_i1.p1  ORF type:complete len:494 (+),score=141.48 TRINITY_DN31040_c0_g1_i1:101-1483(+)
MSVQIGSALPGGYHPAHAAAARRDSASSGNRPEPGPPAGVHALHAPPPPPGPPGAGGHHQGYQGSPFAFDPHYYHSPSMADGMAADLAHEETMLHGGAGVGVWGTPWSPGAAGPVDHTQLIVDVWADQLEQAFEQIRWVIVHYPYVAMDTEFPGVVARPVGNFRNNAEFYYQTLRCNVNLLKIIQLGITFCNAEGVHPPGPCTWQFNFRFNLIDDIYAQDSIDLLRDSGIEFERFATQGVDVQHFAELLISSGLVLAPYGSDPPVRWLSFHSGYDFGYLLKILTSQELPADEESFFELMNTWFPEVFDVKYLLKQTGGALSDMCGLTKLGEDLQVERIGPAHQAGSDSLLTCHCFFKLVREYLGHDKAVQYANVLYGLGQDKGECGGAQFQQGPRDQSNGWMTGASPATYAPPSGFPGTSPVQPGAQQSQYIQHVVYRGTSAPASVRNMQQQRYDAIMGT